jgi:4-amino-4-deoxy-L-arabinose transferase-like glycosyltransferase
MTQESKSENASVRRKARARKIALFLILALHFTILVMSAGRKSVTSDEPFHIARGVSALFSGDFRLNVAHPPLVNMICALPLLTFEDLRIPFKEATWQNPNIDHFLRKMKFFNLLLWVHDTWQWKGNPDPLRIIFWTRVPVMIMSVILGLLIYLWAARLHGTGAGFAALGLYCFSPTVIAHSRLVTTDTGAALFILIFAMALSRHLRSPSWKSLILCAACFGLAQLAKYTSILLVPLLPVVLILAKDGPYRIKFRQFFALRPSDQGFLTGVAAWILIVLMGALVIWAGYGFEIHSIHRIEAPEIAPFTEPGLFIKTLLVRAMAAVPIPPRTYYYGLSVTLLDTAEHFHPLYFLGRISERGWWYYYPLLFLMKEPLALLFIILLFLAAARKYLSSPMPESLMFLVFGAGTALFFMFLNQKNIGIRHLLPAYPFLFICLAGLFEVRAWRGLLPWAAWALLVVYAANAFSSYPDYLVHFNSLVGGPGGGLRYSVVGEDWGQDVMALGEFCGEKGITNIHYNPYGNADPRAYGVPNVPFKCGFSEKGWYAAHVVDLRRPIRTKAPDCYKPFLKMEPRAVLHHTIYIYYVSPR